MTKKTRILTAVTLILALTACIFTGCSSGGAKDLKVEPFDMEWGITQEEAGEMLKCVYSTNEKSPDTIYVANGDNDGTLQAFGTTPSLIIYSFNVVKADSDTPRLGEITIFFPKEDYDAVLAALDSACGKRYFENTQWGTTDSNVYLFEEGCISIKYSSSPLTNPEEVEAESRDRYIALSGMTYSSQQKTAAGYKEMFGLLWMYSTAKTDFVKVDNTK